MEKGDSGHDNNILGDIRNIDTLIRKRFHTDAIYQAGDCLYNTVSERRIRRVSNLLRGKAEWIAKANDPETRKGWLEEAKELEHEITDSELQYVYDELKYYAMLHVSGIGIYLGTVEQVWISDSLVGENIEKEIKQHAFTLESEIQRHVDKHANVNKQVVYLVDPSLYPLDYRRTMLLPSTRISSPKAALNLKSFGCCPGSLDRWSKAISTHANNDSSKSRYFIPKVDSQSHYYYSRYSSQWYCWLPTEFHISPSGDVHVGSYINNLHPVKHESFYSTIANVFGKFVPMLEQVITDLVHPRESRVDPNTYSWDDFGYSCPDSCSDADFDEKLNQWLENRVFLEPQPGTFKPPDRPAKPYCLRGRSIQAVFEMSNIELTPRDPMYKGDMWRIIGSANERIIAAGVYYYDVANVTDGNLSFRELAYDTNVCYQNEDAGTKLPVDLVEGEAAMVQETGSVNIKHGRCIVFPNTYQHRNGEFRLVDPAKPGHRKAIVFYFVDPSTRIPSTEIVPPQQQEWWAETLLSVKPFDKLPDLVIDKVLGKTDFPVNTSDAKNTRLDLYAEHAVANDKVTSHIFEPVV
ncbi:hypothetical protein IW140_006485 [Coemansia sp. RSA 1813]|nr:hypothetical protein EV178_006453 [Coemansia sp. RSA 1646]KAJ1765027.1 hypothetical protein LPJ74_006503 [Coemansia sp. RSA 1843]KAJ2085187.1 hypothetical protein IW138_006456 [Coemansia sp. RSA 986]KAJ2210179.1 hypothetical protein EV179_006405 [Coemansia sp. RSA 487]KAJ2562066.1 hypothetical protein IW140_006485 [Coemansia sp. RSA 1813]